MKIKWLILVFSSSLLLGGCTSYNLGDKTFSSMDGALNYQQRMYQAEIDKVTSQQYFGGSILVVIPSDRQLSQPPFLIGDPNPALQHYFLKLYKRDFEAVKSALEKSNMFDNVDVRQIDSYQNYSKKHGYRYLAVSNGDGSWTIHDLYLDLDKVARFPKDFATRINLLESIIVEFEATKSAEQFLSND